MKALTFWQIHGFPRGQRVIFELYSASERQAAAQKRGKVPKTVCLLVAP